MPIVEIILGVLAAAFAIPSSIQASGHIGRRLLKGSSTRGGVVPHEHQYYLSGHTSHSFQIAEKTYHNLEHNIFVHLGSGIIALSLMTVLLLLATFYYAYHLGHAHGYNGRLAIVQGIDFAVNQTGELLLDNDAGINPIIIVLSFITRILEGIGEGLLWFLRKSFWSIVAVPIFVVKTIYTVTMAVLSGLTTTWAMCLYSPWPR